MTFDSILSNPTELALEISPDIQTSAWEQSQAGGTAASRWNAYLNQLCLQVFLGWLRAEHDPQASPWPCASALPSFWEVVNGTALSVGGARLVLIPSEAVDLSEVRVPQEWVDLPGWAGDYYLAAQVNPDEQWVRIWGYSTHQKLKNAGDYDAGTRTYVLDEDEIIADLNALWVARRLCPDEPTRANVASLPTISSVQAENLLQRLGNPSVLLPRLAVPFILWGAILTHGGWRQQLARRRRGLPAQEAVLQWLQTGVSQLAQQLGWRRIELQPLASARGEASPTLTPALVRQLAIAGQFYQLRLFPLTNLDSPSWRIELQSLTPGGQIPAGFKLRLLTEDLQPFVGNEITATTAVDQLAIEVALEPGEGLVWEVEPTPEDYDQEILRF